MSPSDTPHFRIHDFRWILDVSHFWIHNSLNNVLLEDTQNSPTNIPNTKIHKTPWDMSHYRIKTTPHNSYNLFSLYNKLQQSDQLQVMAL